MSMFVSCGGGSGGGLPSATIQFLFVDGVTVKALNATPVPRAVHFKVTFNRALSADEKTQVESAFILKQVSTDLSHTFAWAADNISVIVTPSRWFKYEKAYTVGLESSSTTNFTTATRNDLNGDGYSDMAIGAVSYPATYRGLLNIYLNNAGSLPAIASSTITGASDRIFLSTSFTYGDFNADGYFDLAVSGTNSNAVYLFLGSQTGIQSCDLANCVPNLIVTTDSSRYYGTGLDMHGDLNSDGYDDLVISAFDGGAVGVHNGRVYIINGSTSVSGTVAAETGASTILSGASASGGFGISSSTSGDFNADGVDDLAVGSLKIFDNMIGSVDIFYGSSSGIQSCDLMNGCSASVHIAGPAASKAFSFSLSIVGDTNGDGYDDLLVGAAGDLRFGGDKGWAYLYHGSASFPSQCDPAAGCSASAVITGAAIGSWTGVVVSGAGDVNNDGFADILIGAPGIAAGLKGNGYVFNGLASGITSCDLSTGCAPSPASTSNPGAVLTGKAVNDGFAATLAAAGDINHDGFDDIIVGALEASGGGVARGEAYIFDGSVSGVADCDISAGCATAETFLGEVDNANFGALSTQWPF